MKEFFNPQMSKNEHNLKHVKKSETWNYGICNIEQSDLMHGGVVLVVMKFKKVEVGYDKWNYECCSLCLNRTLFNMYFIR